MRDIFSNGIQSNDTIGTGIKAPYLQTFLKSSTLVDGVACP